MGDLIKIKPNRNKTKSKSKTKEKIFSKSREKTRGLFGTAMGLIGIGAAIELLD